MALDFGSSQWISWAWNCIIYSVGYRVIDCRRTWWRYQMETFSALPVPGEFPAQRSVTQSFDVFFDMRLNKRLIKQSWGWWFETQSRPSRSHSNELFSNHNFSCWWPGVVFFHLCNVFLDPQFMIMIREVPAVSRLFTPTLTWHPNV